VRRTCEPLEEDGKMARVEMVGTESLTVPQAKALIKAALAVVMRHDFRDDDDTITPTERRRLGEAIEKLEFAIRE
jgi:hypothetical protein